MTTLLFESQNIGKVVTVVIGLTTGSFTTLESFRGIVSKLRKQKNWRIIYEDGDIQSYNKNNLGNFTFVQSESNLTNVNDWCFFNQNKIPDQKLEDLELGPRQNIIDYFKQNGWNLHVYTIPQPIPQHQSKKPEVVIPVVSSQNPIDVKINIYDVFIKTPMGKNNHSLKNQFKFYMLYMQTYVLDIAHDFEDAKIDRQNIGEYIFYFFRDTYIEHIADVYNTLFGTTINTNQELKEIIKEEVLNVKGDYINPSNEYNISQIFEGDAYKLLKGQPFLVEVMDSILNVMGMPRTEIPNFMTLDYTIFNNYLTKENSFNSSFIKNVAISQDVIPSRSKSQLLRDLLSTLEDTPDIGFNITSIANKYDAGGKGSGILSFLTKYNFTDNLHVYEHFTFTINGNQTRLNKDIIDYTIEHNQNVYTLTINSSIFTNHIISSSASDKTAVIQIIKDSETTTINGVTYDYSQALCKTIGDKAKRDFFYKFIDNKSIYFNQTLKGNINIYNGSKKRKNYTFYSNEDKIWTVPIFISNDILSAMIGSIFFEGSVISGSSFPPQKINENVEYLAVRNGSVLQSILKNKYTIKRLLGIKVIKTPPTITGSLGNLVDGYMDLGKALYSYVSLRPFKTTFGKRRKRHLKKQIFHLKSVDSDIKYLKNFIF
jgi:hypothetical protein